MRFNFDYSYLSLAPEFYTELAPTPVVQPELVLVNSELAHDLALDFAADNAANTAELLSGNRIPEGARPFAQAYAGHQFGHLAMLGDGRALVLGEQVLADGSRFDLQLKGSGRTPYSRQGDGRAALGPMLREYLVSEAMHALGVPTTRSLAVVQSGEWVFREQALAGAILTRVASSHIRIGTFVHAAALAKPQLLRDLLSYTIQRHYPDLLPADNPALALLEAVAARQAGLLAHWQRVGFIHGVMNTDNVALSGETIDYGPCAFLDSYDPKTVFSSIDCNGRYCFGNQPAIGQWNLARFAESLLPVLHDDRDQALELARAVINDFAQLYQEQYLRTMRAKLGLAEAQADDEQLIADLLSWMHSQRADYTNSFLALLDEQWQAPYTSPDFQHWHQRWRRRAGANVGGLAQARQIMQAHNPRVIPRNHAVEQALESALGGDMQDFHNLLAALRSPYRAQEQHHLYQRPVEIANYRTFCGT